MANPPLVSCIMVTGKDPSRVPLALAAIASFRQQTYRNSELVIINTGEPLPLGNATGIRQHVLNPDLTLGELRNAGLELAAGSFVAQFDDDDWSHPARIEQQLAAAIKYNCPVSLLRQVRYCFRTNNAFVLTQKPRPDYAIGLPGTVLHHRTDFRYQPARRHEDTWFLKQFDRVHILDNSPELYLRFEHGANTWGHKHLMGRLAAGRNRRELPSSANGYLNYVLQEHYACLKR